jgi:CheY-like chemotaxis protein
MSISAANGTQALVVLVVEDEVLVRCEIVNCLGEAGYVVVETGSGEEAIALCKSSMSIDMMFTDINLAGAATGWDVAEYFKAHRPNVSVLYTSGKPIDPRHYVPGSMFVSKPYQSADVLSAFRTLRTR